MNSTTESNKVAPEGFNLFLYRTKKHFSGPDPYLTIAGVFLWLFAYWVLCEGLQIWRFTKLPGPVAISKDWFSTTPFQGISIFTQEYYDHIYVSCQRILIAFGIATGPGNLVKRQIWSPSHNTQYANSHKNTPAMVK